MQDAKEMPDLFTQNEGFLMNPRESLAFEIKGWLDLKEKCSKQTLAKSITALINHGGGRILIGYTSPSNNEMDYEPDPNSQYINQYTTDKINNVVRGFVEPSMHCEVLLQMHGTLQQMFPIIVVPPGIVPTRLKKGDNSNEQANTYFIRKPGPCSEPASNANEWKTLIHRCVLNDKDTLLNDFRRILEYTGYQHSSTESQRKK